MNLEMFTKTVIPIKDKLYRLALRVVGNPMEAEDVVQEVFIKLWNQREQADQIQNLEAWCVRVTKNLSIDKLRSGHRKMGDLPTGMEFHDDGVSPHKAAELGDAVENIRRMILRLPESQRAVIQLRDIEGLSYQEVADALDLSMEQVKVYLHRARKTIREQIIQNEKYGIENH